MLKLVRPSVKYLQSALIACQEFVSDIEAFDTIHSVDKMTQMLPDNAEQYFYQLYMAENGINLEPNHVP